MCRLFKFFYGFKQSFKCWFDKINVFLLFCGFIYSSLDFNMYVFMNIKGMVVLVLYVDDLILAVTCLELFSDVKILLINKFKMKQLGNLIYCFSVQVYRSRFRGIIFIYQVKYIADIVLRFNMADVKFILIFIVFGVKFLKVVLFLTESEKFEMVKVLYKVVIGCLIYLIIWIRIDIVKVTQELV